MTSTNASDSTPPALPAEALHGPVGRIAAAVAAHTQAPVDLAVLVALGTLSAATRGRYRVHLGGSWTERLALYTAALAPSGERRTVVHDEVTRPLHVCESAERGQAESKYLVDLRIAQRRYDLAVEAAASAPGDRYADAVGRAQSAAVELAALELAARPWTSFGDIAERELPELLAAQGGAGAQFDDHGGLLAHLSRGEYSSGTRNLLLCAYGGEIFTGNGVNGRVRLDEPFLALVLAATPQVVADAGRVRDLRRLLERFLFVLPLPMAGRRASHGVAIPEAARVAWAVSVEDLFATAVERGEPVTLTLSPDAREVFDAFRAAWEPRLHPATGDLADLGGWARRLPGHLARIAALYALADDAQTTAAGVQHVTAAVSLADYLAAHARLALGLAGVGEGGVA